MRRLTWILALLLVSVAPFGGRLHVGIPQALADDDGEDSSPEPPDEAPPPETEPPPQEEPPPRDTEPPEEAPDPESFRSDLAPYGQWYYRPGLGWVWHPSAAVVGTDFRPYETGGHWVSTQNGWAFTSEYPFGGIVFHYGRWYLDNSYGWLWAPGTEWAPAWVDWREGGGYVGWEPLPPDGATAYASPDTTAAWCFVPAEFFATTDVFVHVIPETNVRQVFVVTQPANHTTASHGVRWNRGPVPVSVQRVHGTLASGTRSNVVRYSGQTPHATPTPVHPGVARSQAVRPGVSARAAQVVPHPAMQASASRRR